MSAACAVCAAGIAAASGALARDGSSADVQTYQYSTRQPLGDSDSRALSEVLQAARLGDTPRIRNLMGSFSDPLARKIALWALIETNPPGLSYAEADDARRELADWPGAGRRQALAEKALDGGGLRPQSVIDWFAGADPVTPEGAMALASAYQATGQNAKATDVIRKIWRTKSFDPIVQQQMIARFGSMLGPDDYAARGAGVRDADAQSRAWRLAKEQVVTAIRAGDVRGAYQAAVSSGADQGQDGAEAEFYAGWLALDRMHDAKLADQHFERLQHIGLSPITVSRALYWRGKAAEAMGDPVGAQIFYGEGAKYLTAFYGQLSAIKAGVTQITLGKDPEITAADRARFEDREPIRAARMIAQIGARDSFKSFVMSIAETLPSAAEAAQLVDLTRNLGDQELSMKVVRKAAQHGFILPERGYPLRTPPSVGGAPETAFVLGITRQESGFDPRARSGAGATGMMQLMPSTARILAHKYGFGSGELEDATYNMQLGSAFLGQLVDQFSGSYVMAAAAYNAGPNRPTEWATFCGDPRASSTDPADYIECIPFSETRDYVMRVMEATEVYRARLAGGTAKLQIATDLKRGGYGGYAAHPYTTLSSETPIGATETPR
jgi:soluble lytic murein transglycosylase-like protein